MAASKSDPDLGVYINPTRSKLQILWLNTVKLWLNDLALDDWIQSANFLIKYKPET